jgi:diguanylate cyclase
MSAPQVPQATPALLAKAALKRLALDRLEPTPDNYLKAYEAECKAAGVPAPVVLSTTREQAASAVSPTADRPDPGPQWSDLIGRITRGLERPNKQWTAARKKESLHRVLTGSRQSAERLLQRLQQLTLSWDKDDPDSLVSEDAEAEATTAGHPPAPASQATRYPTVGSPAAAASRPEAPPLDMVPAEVATSWHSTLQQALPENEVTGREAAMALDQAFALALQADQHPIDHVRQQARQACEQARRVIEHRHHLVTHLTRLCQTLTDSLVDLAENDSWVAGQCQAMQAELTHGLTPRGSRRLHELLRDTRERQKTLRAEREAARMALKDMLHQMLNEIGALGQTTGTFQDKLLGYADTIGQADTLESLAGVVRDLVADSRTVHGVIHSTQERLQAEHSRATVLADRVRTLEDELRRLSEEVATDPLTQIANRRGLEKAFETERARVNRQGAPMAIGLLDVDNFKKLNDTLGHQTGDEALKFLARRVSESLRPMDVVARYGGEEFVVLLPNTQAEEAQGVLTRLQRQLSAEFFTQGEQKVFITFSAGVTLYRDQEPIETALERADLALYDAKRTGKNRTCLG